MAQYIPKDALVAELNRKKIPFKRDVEDGYYPTYLCAIMDFEDYINTLEVKEVDEQKERMSECPYRQVGCTMYEGRILECRGACSWVVDYPKLKELKAQKGEEV